MSEFARRFVHEVRQANPKIVISLSPGPDPWAKENYLCDWPAWSRWISAVGRPWTNLSRNVTG